MHLPAELYRIDNLRRAWRWIRSNPDAGYKTYFREHYANYSIAQDTLLRDLSERLRRGVYQPAPASKIYLPKPSGILRPYYLLEVEDQITYQAAANLVAERLLPKVRHRYMKQIFGHLYAGSNGPWFYRKWASGYRAFNAAAVSAFDAGRVFTASFDLTAFYDSIDHRVLTHCLDNLGMPRDVTRSFCEWLSAWTGTDVQILQGHGIPQGPLSSGLIAETVLTHFDSNAWDRSGVTYLRYVDDIRLFARSEHHLRAALIRLDHLSKDVGLFPQSSKIGIHQVSDIRSELKSVSQPLEPTLRAKSLNRTKLHQRLAALSRRYVITDKTRFKYLLAHATPAAALTARLWRVLDNAPDLYESVARYLGRAKLLPRATSRELIRRIETEDLYPAVAAAFLRAANGSIHPDLRKKARTTFKRLWAPRSRTADFTAALGRWLLAEQGLTSNQIRYACAHARSSWTRSALLLACDPELNGEGVILSVSRAGVLDRSADPSIAAAALAGRIGQLPNVPVRQMKRQAALVLKEFGLVRRAGGRACGINSTLSTLLERDVCVKWSKLFKQTYRHAERQLVSCRGYASTDATAWVQGLDVFNDWLLDALFRFDKTLGGYTLGKIGSCTGSPSAAFKAAFPHTLALAVEVHNQRYQSDLAHPKAKKTQKPTGRIRYSFIAKTKRLLSRAVNELSAHEAFM